MFKTLDDIEVNSRTVIVRGDLNVPMLNGTISDTTRIERLVPTLRELSDKGARVVILSHFGRPEGKATKDMSLQRVAAALSAALDGRTVCFIDDCVGEPVKQAVAALEPGEVILLENLRFHVEEEANDREFAAELASLGDIYVNDAFSAAHRAHASTAAITRFLPAFAGRSLQAECAALRDALETPTRPVMAIVGGAKISTKLAVLGNLMSRVDDLVIGGAMANTFLAAQGVQVGKSLIESTMLDEAKSILGRAKEVGCSIHLPTDAIVAANLEPGIAAYEVTIDEIPTDSMILDIGAQTITTLNSVMENCRTIVWNGPLGVFEVPPFDSGTIDVARRAGELTLNGGLISVAGGGDTVAALQHAGVMDQFTYVSTAGGAFLEWLEGRSLPGLLALEEN
jgi:phosphoglycerate kinase